MIFKSLLRWSVAACALTFGARVASAQTAAPSRTEASAPATVEEVVVTGGKRAENVQDVPASVFVASATRVEGANVGDFDDLVKITPSLTITKTSQPGNNSINIRGIGTYAFSVATEPSVAVVIDDIPQAFQAEAFTALVDVAQVEVLRGPQSTLFGQSASAGVINITTKAPTRTFSASVEAMATSDHEERVQGTLSGPIGDKLAIALTGNYSTYRGNVFNLTDGHWLNGDTDETLRAKIVWEPAADWEVTLSPHITNDIASCCAAAQYFLSPGVTFSKGKIPQSVILNGITPGPNNRAIRNDVDAQGNAFDYGAGLKITRQFNGFTLSSITSYDHYELDDRQDTDLSDFNFALLNPKLPAGGSANGGDFFIGPTTPQPRFTSPPPNPPLLLSDLFFL